MPQVLAPDGYDEQVVAWIESLRCGSSTTGLITSTTSARS